MLFYCVISFWPTDKRLVVRLFNFFNSSTDNPFFLATDHRVSPF